MPNQKNNVPSNITVSADQINANAKHDLCKAIDKMISALSPTNFNGQMNIDYIENAMSDFMFETQKISLETVSDILSNIDEHEIIALKKVSMQKGE